MNSLITTTPNLSSEKARLYKLFFDMFFSGELTLTRFAHLTDQTRFLLSEGDGDLQKIGDELSSILESSTDNPELLLELNRGTGQSNHRYISLQEAQPHVQKLYARLLDFLKHHNSSD